MSISNKGTELPVSNTLSWDQCTYCKGHMDESFIHLDNFVCATCYAKERARLEPCASCEKPLRCGWELMACDKAQKYLNEKYGDNID